MNISQTVVAPTIGSHIQVAEGLCPVCDQPIPNDRADQVRARIHELSHGAIATLEEQFAKERAQLLEQAQKDNVAAVEKVRSEILSTLTAAQEEERRAKQQKIDALKQEKAAVEIAHKAEELRLVAKLEELKRQLENKTANELGGSAEIDLFAELNKSFPGDRIRRVEKGAAGADIIHVIVHKSKECGTIIYEFKNSTAWRNDYVTKLREDQIAEKAEHAILSTCKLPADVHQIDIREGVIVALPERVLVLAEILRREIVHSHELRRSGVEREQKTDALYSYITSPAFGQHLEFIDIVTSKMFELDSSEQKAHKALWKKRDGFIKSMQEAEGNLRGDIDQIIGAE